MGKDSPDKFKVIYEVEDGYLGGARPHSFYFDAGDLGSMTDAEIEQSLDDAAHEDMLQKINADIRNRDEFMAWARARRAVSEE